MNSRSMLIFAAISGLIFVTLGALGSHGLAKVLDARQMSWLQTGLQYQSIHTLAILALGILTLFRPNRCLHWSGLFLTLGTVLFSGSLYVLAIASVRVWPYITPLGGFALMIGWVLMLLGVLKLKQKDVCSE